MTSIHEAEQSSAPSGEHRELEEAQARCAALVRRNDELELVIAAARLGFCMLDSETRTLHANSQFKAEFGWAPDAQPDWQGLEERLAPEDRALLVASVREALTAGVDFDLEVRAAWSAGRANRLALQGRTVNDGTDHRRLIVTARNITAEKHGAADPGTDRLVDPATEQAAAIEHERRLRCAAETANRGKDHFLFVFSHELRSPLNAILGWNRILALKRREDVEIASITARIEHSARAQLKMVNDLLDLARIETGKLRIEPRPMQLAKVISAALDLAKPAATAKRIALHTDLQPGAGQVRGDPDRLQQVVANLLSNAVKFTGAGGEITVGLRTVGAFSELSVEDNGQGIEAGVLPHVFDRFNQTDGSTTANSGGLGLGLALVREIVTLHGGAVSAHSAGVGRGARFVATFPARQPWRASDVQNKDDPALTPSPASLCGLSILVVDDEPDARLVVAETLKLEGASVTVTDSAMSALAKLQEAGAHFDVIVTDIGMPEEDGYSLVRRLRALKLGRQMVAIAVTGYASNSDVAAAIDAGFDLHVPKPVDFNTFVPLVRKLAGTGRSQMR